MLARQLRSLKKHGIGGKILVQPAFLVDWRTESVEIMSRSCCYKPYTSKIIDREDGSIKIDFSCVGKSK